MYQHYKHKVRIQFFIGTVLMVLLILVTIFTFDFVFNGFMKDLFLSLFPTQTIYSRYTMYLIMLSIPAGCLLLAYLVNKDHKELQNLALGIKSLPNDLQRPQFSDYPEIWDLFEKQEQHYREAKLEIDHLNDMNRQNLKTLISEMRIPILQLHMLLNFMEENAQLTECYYERAWNKSKQLEELFQMFFQIVRFQIDTETSIEEEIRVARIFEQMLEEYRVEIDAKNLTCSIAYDYKVRLMMNRILCVELLRNVVKNCLIYARDSAVFEISMDVNEEGTTLHFYVEGDPMSDYEIQRLFHQLPWQDENIAYAHLGLAFIKKAMDFIGGQVECSSEQEGLSIILIFGITN